MIKMLEISGNAYEIGKQLGIYFKDFLNKEIIPYYEAYKKDGIAQKITKLQVNLQKEFPEGLEEINGRADGAQIDRNVFFLMFCPEIFDLACGCTTVMMKDKNGNVLFSHNEDDSNFSEENVALVRYNYKDHWIVGYTMATKLIGCFFGYNSYGLAFSSNSISCFEKKTDNLSRYITERKILNAKTIEEAIEIARSLVVASPFSINVLDIEKKEAINIEKDYEDIYLTELDDRYARSNHFLKKKGEIKISTNSLFRYQKSQEQIDKLNKENVKLEDLINILAYHTDDFYQTIEIDCQPNNPANGRTVANFAVDTINKKVIIKDRIGGHRIVMNYYEFNDLNNNQ